MAARRPSPSRLERIVLRHRVLRHDLTLGGGTVLERCWGEPSAGFPAFAGWYVAHEGRLLEEGIAERITTSDDSEARRRPARERR